MSLRGRPTLYQPGYPELARRFCQLGATNQELADFLGVARATIDDWLRVHPEFAEAVRQGRDMIDMVVAEKLLSRVMGYTHEGRKVVLHRGEEREIAHIVHYPPDVRACIFWLRNRRRTQWQEAPRPAPDDDGPRFDDLEAASRRVAQRNTQAEGRSQAEGSSQAEGVSHGA